MNSLTEPHLHPAPQITSTSSRPTRKQSRVLQPQPPPSHGCEERELWLIEYTVKDKAQHAVVLDKAISDKLNKDVQSYRLITVAVLVDRLKINGSVARMALADLEEKGVIKRVVKHSALSVYST